jgi:cation:H+ antiporter
MILLGYTVFAVITVLATVKAAHYIQQLDQQTKLSGAFLGGLVFASVTSLPELISSLSATFILNQPALAFGNVFGSNLFNMALLAGVDLIFVKHFFFNRVNQQTKLNAMVFLMYLAFIVPLVIFTLSGSLWMALPFSVTSLVIVVLYALSVKDVLSLPSEATPSVQSSSLKATLTAFTLSAVVVIGASLGLTYYTQEIALAYNLNTTFAGAIFLGAATSLPELTAIVSLVKLKAYDIALGNIVGSSIFNFMILALVDLLAFRRNLYHEVLEVPALRENLATLLLFGALNTIMIHVALTRRKTTKIALYILPSSVIIILYVLYLFV